jgi:ATP-binding cassette subfamily F protein uup
VRVICVDLASVSIAQPDKTLFDAVSVTVSSGDRAAIVGVNGSGKTTLLQIMAGLRQPDSGHVRFGKSVRIAVLEQDPVLPSGTVSAFLSAGEVPQWEVEAVATSLGVQHLFQRATGELSGGQAKRVALARALVGEHDLILLDEPTNHLDLEAIEWLEHRLADTRAALVVITHDRHLMDRLTTARGEGRVIEIEDGQAHVHRAAAGTSAYAAYLEGRTARHEQAAGEEATRKILARRELQWLLRGAPARSTKPKARLRSANEIVSGGRRQSSVRDSDLLLDVGTTRLGNQVIELIGVAQSYGSTPVLTGVDLLIEPGGRLGVVGPNGSGKTTLLDIVAGRARPSAGTVRRGSTVVTGYADQHTTLLDPDAIVREIVAGPLRQPDWEDRALLERFWFDSTAQYAPVRMLSGGERRRLQLVMVLATKPNLLVLDEPTNDLDLDTLRALEDFLDEWPGALIVASHDRTFLDRTVDHVLAIEAGGGVARVPGGVEGWLRARLTASPAGRPARSVRPPMASAERKPSRSTIGRKMRETEQSIERAQRVVDRLRDELAAAAEHTQLAAVGTRLADAQQELTRLEERWLELAEDGG